MLDETRVNGFLISLSYPRMYGGGSIIVLEGVVKLRMRLLLA